MKYDRTKKGIFRESIHIKNLTFNSKIQSKSCDMFLPFFNMSFLDMYFLTNNRPYMSIVSWKILTILVYAAYNIFLKLLQCTVQNIQKKKNPLNLTLFDYGSRTATFSSQLIFAIFNSRGPYHLRTIA